MTREEVNSSSPFARFWLRLKGHIVAPVPASSARCEFECRELQCSEGEWDNCEARAKTAKAESAVTR